MYTGSGPSSGFSLRDGLGVRVVAGEADDTTEVLDVAEVLASHPAAEQSIRARAARYADLGGRTVAGVKRVERCGDALRVVSDAPGGIRLSDLLTELESGQESLSDGGVLEIAAETIAAVAALHELPGGLSHGAVSPAHAILTQDGRVTLTDAAFGTALEALQRNREELWREFGLALPAAASLPRFDQRADVTQLGTLVLAFILRRPLRSDEYPRGIADLVMASTRDLPSSYAPALTMWLQQSLQLHHRAVFGSAVGAQRAFAEIVSAAGLRRAGAQSVQAVLRRRWPVPAPPAPPPVAAPRRPGAPPLPAALPQSPPPRSPATLLRSMFSNIRAS